MSAYHNETLVILSEHAQDMEVEDTVRGVLSIPKMGLKFVRPSVRSSVKRQDLRLALASGTAGVGGESVANGVATAVITVVASGRVDNGRTMSVGSSM